MKYKTILLLSLIAFSVTLAVIVGQRLSAESMAVIVGVVAGVAASIPTSLIVVWVAARPAAGSQPAPAPMQSATPAGQPRLVMVQPQAAAQPLPPPTYSYVQPQSVQHLSYAPAYSMPAYAPPPQRTFTVIGGEALEGTPQVAWATDEAELG
jgi:hypothetical protein